MNVLNRIGVVGAGNMGRALIAGMSEKVGRDNLWAAVRTDKSHAQVVHTLGVATTTKFLDLLPGTTLLLLCVKPPQVRGMCEAIRDTSLLSETTPVISVAAGVTVRTIEEALGGEYPVIRAMPNTPCQIKRGMTVLCRGTHTDDWHLNAAHEVFRSVGETMELAEAYFDAATSVNASGPAFMYLILEAVTDGAVRMGLPHDVARSLAVECMLGSAAMVRTTRLHPATLRDAVTTPAGCTIGGLMVLEDGKLRSVLARAIEETTRIASGLGR